MFNGIIHNTGKVKFILKNKKSYNIGVETNLVFKKKDIGSSISCNGVCLTLTSITKKMIYFFISIETLNRSNLKYIKLGNIINLEKSLVYGKRVSGHYVQGHVDTTAIVKNINFVDKSWIIKFKMKKNISSNYLVEKASISINGVSLTVSKVYNNIFEINIIPHTLKLTNLKSLKSKDIVNIELDIFSKYVHKILKQ